MQDFIAMFRMLRDYCSSKSVDCKDCAFKYRNENNIRMCALHTIPSDLNMEQLQPMVREFMGGLRRMK